MDGKTVLDSGSIAGLPTDPVWNVAGLGDLDGGDGRTDVVLRHPDGQWLHAPLRRPRPSMPNIAVEPNLTKSTKWSIAGIADLNGDGRDDILLRHEDGRWHYYPMNGSLSGPGRGSVSGVTKSLDWRLAGLGDLNGDGRDDILLRHVEGRWTFYPMNGRNVMAGKGGVSLSPNTAWHMAGVGDLNGDGNDDALLRHEDGRWTYYPLDGRTILAGRGTAGITRNPDWSTKGPEPDPDEAEAGTPEEDETAESVFHASIASIVETKCATCHSDGGVSGNTRLVFSTGADQQTANLATFEDFLAEVDEGATLILNKVQGVSHGGGIQLAAGTEGFAAMERFLALLQGGPDGGPSVTPATLFDGVKMEPARSTLRRAAIVFAGRIPTEAEYDSIKTGGIASLRKAIRGLTKGQGFHEFLIRNANDRLLTDRSTDFILKGIDTFIDYTNKRYDLMRAEGSSSAAVHDWMNSVQYGARRAPLELIARIAQKDLPYTEVLTANYVMANPWAAEAYGASTKFNDPTDPHEFQPSDIHSYYRRCDGQKVVHNAELGHRFIEKGPCSTDYRHAGILSTKVFLQRYPTTATNRNRARSRWTYYHFLSTDIEKSASRTTDPVALADTNNPTLHNPACTVCHSVLDPVAGAFQNYGDEGLYRDQWGGMHSLDRLYRDEYAAGKATHEITAMSRSSHQTIAVSGMLPAGRELLRLQPRFGPADTDDIWWNMAIDHVTVRDSGGKAVFRVELQNVTDDRDLLCGRETAQIDEESGDDYYEAYFCPQDVLVDIPSAATYTVEVAIWMHAQHRDAEGHQRFVDMSLGGFQEGDTWFRDMRSPGFDGDLAPSPDNSVQWLAKRIIADPRFAQATVVFWWPAVMGSEVVEPPSEGDPDFEGRLLASNAQSAEVERLARAFRRGFGGGKRYNLNDLLTEITLSKWFRADMLPDDGPTRRIALANAGARRLLTPEELARKTDALTGFLWLRGKNNTSFDLGEQSNWTNAQWKYGLLYGGIDSDGITERGRDLTSVMAGVAQRVATATACPVVMRDFYLVHEQDRMLLRGLDKDVAPAAPAIKRKLVELYGRLLGAEVDANSKDVLDAYEVFVDVLGRQRAEGTRFRSLRCDWNDDYHYLDGIIENARIWRDDWDWGEGHGWDWDRINAHFDTINWSDPLGIARAWVVILTYLMTDPRYLHL